MSVGERLKQFRKVKNLSQRDIATTCNTTQVVISRYEQNLRFPSIKFISNLNKIYRLDINWLLTGRGSMFLDNGTKMKADVPMFTRKFTDDEHSGLSDREYIEKVQDEVLELRKDLDELRRKLIDLQQKYIELMEKMKK